MVEQWRVDPQGERIFWLSGMAGTGKSTIARTLSRSAYEEKRLGASFFFARGKGDRGNASRFFTSIAYQLSLWGAEESGLAQSIRKAMKEHPDIASRAKRDQWKHFIEEPLSQMKNQPANQVVLILIDALDECEDDRDVQLILTVLFEAENLDNIQIRIFLTSRPSVSVQDGFRGSLQIVYQSFILHEIEEHIILQDLKTFFKYELSIFERNVV